MGLRALSKSWCVIERLLFGVHQAENLMLSDTSVTKHKRRALFTLMKGSELLLDRVPTIEYQAASFGIRNIILKVNIPNQSNKALWRTPESNEFIDKIGPVETNQHEAPLETIPEAKIICCLRQGLLCQ